MTVRDRGLSAVAGRCSMGVMSRPTTPAARRVTTTRALILALSCAAASVSALGCAPPNAAKPYPATEPPAGDATPPPGHVVRYFDRAIELDPFLSGFPYRDWESSLETGALFFFEIGERYTLKMLDLAAQGDGAFDLAGARVISDVDWSARSLWGAHHHAATNTLWLHADERNDEQMNLWTLALDSGALTQITEHDYVYGFGFSEDQQTIAYLPRTGKQAPYRTCLNLLDVASKRAREVVCDSPALTFTWSSLRFSPEGDEVFFNAQIKGDRNRVQLVSVQPGAASPKVKVITRRRVLRNSPHALEGWVDGDALLFLANDDGYNNLYSYSRKTGAIRQLTRFKEDITSARLVDAGVFAVHRTPRGSTIVLVDPRTGQVQGALEQPGTADVIDGHGERVLWTQRAPDIVFEGNLATVTRGEGGKPPAFQSRRVISLDPELERAVVRCEAEAVTIPTFDRDPATGAPRALHAFVLRPKQPLADPAARLAMITAFYGGENRYSTFENIMCAAGLTVVSPAVRGSQGFGKRFSSLNDKDLGGDEIVDLFHVARWVERNLGLAPAQIGVFGGSHGGYATMRALTFPPETNGRNDRYPFGFGLSHAGFSDIKSFYDATNIPDWVVLESGDPGKPDELARMRDRSPLSHVELLEAPLLVTHGANDWRVPVDESRRFVDKARALQKPVTYVEFPGQGHHIEGVERVAQLYQARLDFLSSVARRSGASAPVPAAQAPAAPAPAAPAPAAQAPAAQAPAAQAPAAQAPAQPPAARPGSR